ncbi:hypothetical protein EDD86DRAFT_54872 [Gorgonomyces haynaldii]|nr:hypothetical protein EDD86DRAFT_54872 [Gorgonomyces haynaldii]
MLFEDYVATRPRCHPKPLQSIVKKDFLSLSIEDQFSGLFHMMTRLVKPEHPEFAKTKNWMQQGWTIDMWMQLYWIPDDHLFVHTVLLCLDNTDRMQAVWRRVELHKDFLEKLLDVCENIPKYLPRMHQFFKTFMADSVDRFTLVEGILTDRERHFTILMSSPRFVSGFEFFLGIVNKIEWIKRELTQDMAVSLMNSVSHRLSDKRDRAKVFKIMSAIMQAQPRLQMPKETFLKITNALSMVESEYEIKMATCLVYFLCKQIQQLEGILESIYDKLLAQKHADFPTMIAIYVLVNEPKKIQQLMSQQMGFQVFLSSESFLVMQELFSKNFTLETMVESTQKLLQSDTQIETSGLSISLVYQLFVLDVFRKSHIKAIGYMNLVYNKTRQCHPQLTDLVQHFCNYSIEFPNEFISPDTIRKKLRTVDHSSVMYVYHTLAHRKTALQKKQPTYDTLLVQSFPVPKIMECAERVFGGPLYIQLAAMLVEELPEYFQPRTYLGLKSQQESEIHVYRHILRKANVDPLSEGHVMRVFQSNDLQTQLAVIQWHMGQKHEHMSLKTMIPIIPYLQTQVQREYRHLWMQMYSQMPRQVVLETIQAIYIGYPDKIIHAPQILFDAFVRFDTLDMFLIFLQILEFSSFSHDHEMKRSAFLSEKHQMTAVLEYDCSIVLLCLQKLKDPQLKKPIYLFVHSMFIQRQDLIKQVHAVGYDLHLVQEMVEHVPSLHVLISRIPDLLKESKCNAFHMHLACHLVKKYPLKKTHHIANEFIIPMYRHHFSQLPDWRDSLPALVVLSEAFEDLVPAIQKLLEYIHDQIQVKAVHDQLLTVMDKIIR